MFTQVEEEEKRKEERDGLIKEGRGGERWGEGTGGYNSCICRVLWGECYC